MTTLKILTASRVDAILDICSIARSGDWEPVGKNNTTQIWGLLTPKYGQKKVPYAKLKIFSAYTLIRTRLYDSAASTASPLGSAVSLAMNENGLLAYK